VRIKSRLTVVPIVAILSYAFILMALWNSNNLHVDLLSSVNNRYMVSQSYNNDLKSLIIDMRQTVHDVIIYEDVNALTKSKDINSKIDKLLKIYEKGYSEYKNEIGMIDNIVDQYYILSDSLSSIVLNNYHTIDITPLKYRTEVLYDRLFKKIGNIEYKQNSELIKANNSSIIYDNLKTIFLLVIISTIVMLIITSRIIQITTKSIILVKDKAKAIAEGEIFSRIKYNNDDEIGDIIKEYNSIVGINKRRVLKLNRIAKGSLVVEEKMLNDNDIIAKSINMINEHTRKIVSLADNISNDDYTYDDKEITKENQLGKAIKIMVNSIKEKNNILYNKTEQLEQNNRQIRNIIEILPTCMIVIDAETYKILDINERALELMNMGKDEIVGEQCKLFTCSKSAECPVDNTDKVKNIECKLRVGDKVIPIIKSVVKLELDNKKIIVETFVDITDRQKILDALKESEEQYRSISESTMDALISINNNEKIIAWNNGAVKMFGYKKEEIIGGELTIIIPLKNRKDHKEGLTMVLNNKDINVKSGIIEGEAINKNGDLFDVETSLAKWTRNGQIFVTAIIRDVGNRKKIGKKYEMAMNKAESKVQHLKKSLNDKREKVLISQLSDMDKRDIVQGMKEVVYKDVTYIKNIIETIKETDLNKAQKDYIKEIDGKLTELATTSNDKKNHENEEYNELDINEEPISIKEILDDISNIYMMKSYKKGIRYYSKIEEDVNDIMIGDPIVIKQILKILVDNAIEYTDKGEINISVMKIDEYEDSARLRISVSDTGIGIAGKEFLKIFKNPQKLNRKRKDRGENRVNSLFFCKKLVESMNGKIDVESIQEKNTVFTFEIELKKFITHENDEIIELEIDNGSYISKIDIENRPTDNYDDIITKSVLMDRLDNDQELYEEIVVGFVEDINRQIMEFIEALDKKEIPEIQLKIHTIKGASGNVGAEGLQEIAIKIEKAVKNDDLDLAKEMLGSLRNTYEKFKKYWRNAK
jgi:PAS domain S-box-containing protein